MGADAGGGGGAVRSREGGGGGVRGLTCDGSDGSVFGVGVGATAGVDAVPLPEEATGVSGGGGGAGTLGGACPTAQTVSGECRIGVEPAYSTRGVISKRGGAEKGRRGAVSGTSI